MGIVAARKADPQFVLQPGQSRNATFEVVRYNVGTTAIGTVFTYDVAVEQLQVLPSQQVQSVRQYSLNFPSLAAGGQPAAGENVNDAVKALKDIFKKK